MVDRVEAPSAAVPGEVDRVEPHSTAAVARAANEAVGQRNEAVVAGLVAGFHRTRALLEAPTLEHRWAPTVMEARVRTAARWPPELVADQERAVVRGPERGALGQSKVDVALDPVLEQ